MIMKHKVHLRGFENFSAKIYIDFRKIENSNIHQSRTPSAFNTLVVVL